MSNKITVIQGDGIGPEIMAATVLVLEYLDLGLEYVPAAAGMSSFKENGEYLPEETLMAIEESDAVLAGCVIDPEPTKGYRNPFNEIKKRLGLFADVRIVNKMPQKAKSPAMSLTIIAENPKVESTIFEVESVDGIVLERHTNHDLCRRLTTFAAGLAGRDGHRNVTCVHHASAYKASDGLFRDIFMEVMAGAGLDHGDMEADRAAYELVVNPGRFDVIVTLSPYANLLLGEAAALAGGMHYIPSASLGSEKGFFEPMHGAVPGLAGKGAANPTASILSGAMMLRHLGHGEAAERVTKAVGNAYRLGFGTPDAGGIMGTWDFAEKVCDLLSKD